MKENYKIMCLLQISVRAQEQEDSSTILPFMADLSLTLSALVCSNLEVTSKTSKISITKVFHENSCVRFFMEAED